MFPSPSWGYIFLRDYRTCEQAQCNTKFPSPSWGYIFLLEDKYGVKIKDFSEFPSPSWGYIFLRGALSVTLKNIIGKKFPSPSWGYIFLQSNCLLYLLLCLDLSFRPRHGDIFFYLSEEVY